ncbi:Phosphoserine phosphatase [Candidatus Terasakiella magnetica]|uniref:Phosphoserine phosphatase n=1 Tax=Candidatus Terasakiella magnetica TaxID=1867952 RepID=A0A1C3REC4_9PROT|nr:phosphoserine phosphatase SerB [Candidatus Terasakiella magnetica]SCA55646.1 Phosphoserine phosphatase [Candidatus Terasakiella magnetica]
MSYVLTLIANPDKQQISPKEIIAHIKGADPRCLSEGEAYDVEITDVINLTALQETLPHVDLIFQSTSLRKKKLLIADMDSTIVTGETLDDLAEFAGLKDQVAEITTRAMNGEIPFREALRERVAMLKGLSEEFLLEAMKMVHLTNGAKELVATMKANGAYCALVSGGFTFFTSRVADQVGFDFNAGNNMEILEGTLTGNVIDPIVTKDSKLTYLKSLSQDQGFTTDEAVAVGDGANDLPMILEAGLGIAYHAKPSVIAKAKHNVQNGNLTALLYAQGYKKSEFAS